MIQLALFDIDGTLADFDGATRRAFHAYLSELVPSASDVTVDRLLAIWRETDAKYFDRYLHGELTFPEQRRMRVRDFCVTAGLPLGSEVDSRDLWLARYQHHFDRSLRLYPDVIPALNALRDAGLRLGVISNSSYEHQDHKLNHLGIRKYFETLVCCDNAEGWHKPDRRIFRYACALMKVNPSRTAYIGDRLLEDAHAAQQAGLRGVWLNREADNTMSDVSIIFNLDSLVRELAVFSGMNADL